MTEIASGATFPGQVRAATTLLESIVADRGLLATIPQADGQRLPAACARVYHPDAKSRRLLVKATTVFTTPNVFPPSGWTDAASLSLSVTARCTVLVAQDGKVLVNRAWGVPDHPRYMPGTTVPNFPLGLVSAAFTALPPP